MQGFESTKSTIFDLEGEYDKPDSDTKHPLYRILEKACRFKIGNIEKTNFKIYVPEGQEKSSIFINDQNTIFCFKESMFHFVEQIHIYIYADKDDVQNTMLKVYSAYGWVEKGKWINKIETYLANVKMEVLLREQQEIFKRKEKERQMLDEKLNTRLALISKLDNLFYDK